MQSPFDLSLHLASPTEGADPDVLASITLRCDTLGLLYQGDVLTKPLSEQEEAELRWYLEDYWQWPYEQFLERAKQVEGELAVIGKRLYAAVFGSGGAQGLLRMWLLQPLAVEQYRQISIVSDLPRVLSLPWELLHDEQGFLALRARHAVSIVRRLRQHELSALQTPFEPPLRILLVTARPDDSGFIDPRCVARELLHSIDNSVQAGEIVLEFLRPPTLQALRNRLNDTKGPPIHVLHFDGHGAFGRESVSDDGLRLHSPGPQGLLAFEDAQGKSQLVKADELTQVLQGSSVQLALFNACQSAQGNNDDVFSSVATRLIQGGVDAVVAMSASVLVASATRYVAAFYQSLSGGLPIPTAQEHARQALHDDPRRHLSSRTAQDEGTPIELSDWWLPHLYQQRSVVLKPTTAQLKEHRATSSKRKSKAASPEPQFNEDMPHEPRYGFTGRALELLRIERALLQKKLVVIHGFGGMGKTALAREAADWFTRTGLYQRACFVSFEQGGDATVLLSTLGHFLGIADAAYDPAAPQTALARIKPVVKKQPLLLIADNLESILPAGEAALDLAERTKLWDILLNLNKLGVGVLLTSRAVNFGDGRLSPGKDVLHLPLQGLTSIDAYTFATHLLDDLNIKRKRAPYEPLRELLAALDHHPLAIQLVLPHLRQRSLATIQHEFATLLPNFADNNVIGRNASLTASLEYSLRRLSPEQRALLSRLSVFEGGAMEDDLLAITEIPETEWTTLRPALEQAALLTAEQVHENVRFPYLHFHPVLVPYLRSQQISEEAVLQQRYAQRYYQVADYYNRQDNQHPQTVRAVVRRELPNLRHAWDLVLQGGDVEVASDMADDLTQFLRAFGRLRERDQLRRRLAQVLGTQATAEGGLTQATYLHEIGLAQDERNQGRLRAAVTRLQSLLKRIEAQPEGVPCGHGSFEHCSVLSELSDCLFNGGQHKVAEERLREALALNQVLLVQGPENHGLIGQRAHLLRGLGDVYREQGQYISAKASYEDSLILRKSIEDQYGQAVLLGQLSTLAFRQHDYAEARSRFQTACDQFHALGEPAQEAALWHNLGYVAQELQEWSEAEHCYRESLVLKERLGDLVGTAQTCTNLANLALDIGHASEAEGWYQHALALIQQVEPDSLTHAVILGNLANLLVDEVRASRMPQTRLEEARRYIEQVQRIEERPGVAAESWRTFNILANIAHLQGQQAQAQDYRRRGRDAFAAFAGNRYHIDRQHGELIVAIAKAAQGDDEARAAVEEALPDLEQNGWHISAAVQRVLAGERDWHALVEELGREEALLMLRVLEMLAAPEEAPVADEELSVEQAVASLPPELVTAMQGEDEAAMQQVFEGLAQDEQERVMGVLQWLQEQQGEEEE